MKYQCFVLLSLIFFFVNLANAQWTQNGTTIYYVGTIGLNTANTSWDVTMGGGLKMLNATDASKSLEMAHGGANAFINVVGGGRFDFRIAGNSKMSITNDGYVGIGTTNPGNYLLAVDGSIGARKVEVTLTTPFPDYVFQSDYDLMPLDKLREFINKNQHLPEVPSAKEVEEKGGIELGEQYTLLLKKVEELTLYTLAQEERIKDLEHKLKQQKKE